MNDFLTVSNCFCIWIFPVEKQRFSEVKRDKSQYWSDYRYLEIQIEDLKDTLKRCEDEKEDFQKKCIATLAREKNLIIDLKDVKTQLKSAKQDKSKYSEKCKRLEEEVETLKRTLEGYEDKKEELTKKFNACVMNETHLQTKLTEVNTRLEGAEGQKKQIVEFERKLQSLKDENENILKKVTNLETELEHKSIKLERTKRDIEAYFKKREKLEEEKKELETRLQHSEDEKKLLEKKCNDCSTNEKILEVELKSVTSQLKRAEKAERERIHNSKRCDDLKKQTAEPESNLTQYSEDQTKESTILESSGLGKTASGSRKSGTQGRNNRLFYFKSSSLEVTVFIRLKSPTSN